jgi:hypothetical protein
VAKTSWHLWSTREGGVLMIPQPVERLPKGAEVCGDGDWAELVDKDGVERVFVNLRGARRDSPAGSRAA